ncbi:MAG: ATP-dependent helicase [Propionibacteriaceae bacterium]|nr:ATP-dependent helicase [Propionibacteriaceae bacterium]
MIANRLSYRVIRPAPLAEVSPTPAQRRVIDHETGPLLVIGGPGTGKTWALQAAVADRLTRSDTESVLVLTDTTAASRRWRADLAQRAPGAAGRTSVVSWAGLGRVLVEREEPPLRLLSAAEQAQRVRELVFGQAVSAWPTQWLAACRTERFATEIDQALAALDRAGVGPAALAAAAERQDRADWASLARLARELRAIEALSASVSYDHLWDAAAAAVTEPLATTIVIDHYEAIEPGQLRLLRQLMTTVPTLIVAGDPRQAVNGWRGALTRSTLDFPHWWQSLTGQAAEVVELTEQFRCPPPLQRLLARLASRIPLPRPWPRLASDQVVEVSSEARSDEVVVLAAAAAETAAVDESGQVDDLTAAELGASESPVITAVTCVSPEAEAEWLTEQLRQAHQRGLEWSEMAVIVRAGRVIDPLAAVLTRGGVPVNAVWSDLPLAAEPVVAALLAGLSWVAGDESAALVGTPLAGMTDPTDATGQNLVNRVRTMIEAGQPVVEALWALWADSGWPDQLAEAWAAGPASRLAADRALDAVTALVELAHRRTGLKGRAGLAAFVREVTDQTVPVGAPAQAAERPGVALVTAHRAKGRQWPLVAMAAVQEGLWPRLVQPTGLVDVDEVTADGHGAAPSWREQLASERRLFYLACSRASQRLLISAADQAGTGESTASRFFDDLGLPVRAADRPGPTLTSWLGLVGLLRRTAVDPVAHPALRQAACQQLAEIANLTDQAGRPVVPAADPAHWWGLSGGLSDHSAEFHNNKVEVTSQARRALAGQVPINRADTATEPVITLSGSQVEALLTCPRQWFLARRGRAERGPSVGATVGRLVHHLVQLWHAGTIDQVAAHVALDQAWADIDFPSPWQAAAEQEQAHLALDRFAHWQESRPRAVIAAEVPFDTVVTAGRWTIRLIGRVDRVDQDAAGDWRIADFKTGKVAPSAREAAVHRQLGVYQVASQHGALSFPVRATAPVTRTAKTTAADAATPTAALSLAADSATPAAMATTTAMTPTAMTTAAGVVAAELVFLRLAGSTTNPETPKVLVQPSLSVQPQREQPATYPGLSPAGLEMVGDPAAYPTWVHRDLAAAAQTLEEGRFPAVAGPACRWCQFGSSCPASRPDEVVV